MRENIPTSAEAVVIGGNGFRAVGVIDTSEAELDRPVLTANQVLLWAAMAACGADPALVVGYGRLFSGPLPLTRSQRDRLADSPARSPNLPPTP